MLLRYKASAKDKGLVWNLSDEEVAKITKEACTYCGAPPSDPRGGPKTPWISNGIDRVDNSRGYETENVTACCKTCNYMKRAMTLASFRIHVEKIYAHLIHPQSLV